MLIHLIISAVLLQVVIWYAIWVKLRVVRLQARLLDLRERMMDEAINRHVDQLPAVKEQYNSITRFALHADELCLPVILYLRNVGAECITSSPTNLIVDPETYGFLNKYSSDACNIAFIYLMYDTLHGCMFRLKLHLEILFLRGKIGALQLKPKILVDDIQCYQFLIHQR